MNASKVIIKKYENRRLYDTTHSRYINLEEVADLLRQGVEVQAIDAASGEDITRLILTQIIVEGAKEHDSGLPLDMLRQMVVATGRASQETLLQSARAMMEMYRKAYGAFSPAMTPFDFMQMMNPGAHRAPDPAAEEPARPAASQPEGEVSDLRRRIDELERRIANGASKRKRSGARKKTR